MIAGVVVRPLNKSLSEQGSGRSFEPFSDEVLQARLSRGARIWSNFHHRLMSNMPKNFGVLIDLATNGSMQLPFLAFCFEIVAFYQKSCLFRTCPN